METRHLDTYVNGTKLPWILKGERSTIPPRNSKELEEYLDFIQKTGFGLDMLVARPGILDEPVVEYELPNKKKIHLMKVGAMTRQFFKQTLMHYNLEDVGPEKIREWVNKLDLIRRAALKRKDAKLAEECQEMLAEAKKKWASVIH